MFVNSVNYIFQLTSKIQIQNLILNEMEKLVKSGNHIGRPDQLSIQTTYRLMKKQFHKTN